MMLMKSQDCLEGIGKMKQTIDIAEAVDGQNQASNLAFLKQEIKLACCRIFKEKFRQFGGRQQMATL